MTSRVLKEVEARFNAPVEDVLTALMEKGYSKETASKKIGVAKNTLLAWIRKCEIDWPLYTEERRRQRLERERRKTSYWIDYKDKGRIPLSEAAAYEGVSYKVVLERYKKGERNLRRLFRKVRRYRTPPEVYHVGLSVKEWESAKALARKIGVKAAAQKLGIPMGAVSAALRGEMDRLD